MAVFQQGLDNQELNGRTFRKASGHLFEQSRRFLRTPFPPVELSLMIDSREQQPADILGVTRANAYSTGVGIHELSPVLARFIETEESAEANEGARNVEWSRSSSLPQNQGDKLEGHHEEEDVPGAFTPFLVLLDYIPRPRHTLHGSVCIAPPDWTAITAAPVPSNSSVSAAGPPNAARPLREINLKTTPTTKRAMAKWTMDGW